MATNPALRQAIDALRVGDRTTAQTLLHDLTQTQPTSADGWLWLAAASDDPIRKQTFLQQVLALNPDDRWARAGLHALGVNTSVPFPAGAALAGPKPKVSPPAAEAAPKPAPTKRPLQQPQFTPTDVRADHTIAWQWIAAVVVVVVLLIALMMFMF